MEHQMQINNNARSDDFKRVMRGEMPYQEYYAKHDEAFQNETHLELKRLMARDTAQQMFEESKAQPASAETPDNVFNFLALDDLYGDEPPKAEWLIPAVLQIGQHGVLFSASGMGKSMLTLLWVLDLCDQGTSVLYIDRENSLRDLQQRLHLAGRTRETHPATLHYSLLGAWPSLNTLAGGRAVQQEVARTGAQLVIIDTTMRVTEGDSWKGDTFNDLWTFTQEPLKRAGVAVLRLDHENKGGDLMGSVAKRTDVDMIWQLSQPQADRPELRCEKDRSGYYRQGDVIKMEYHREPIVSVAVVGEGGATSDAFREYLKLEKVKADLDDLGVALDASGDAAVQALKNAGRGARKQTVLAALKERRGDADEAVSDDLGEDVGRVGSGK